MQNLSGAFLVPIFHGGAFALDRDRDGLLHRKTVPHYILARAVEGHYEIHAGGSRADCGEGGAFLAPPGIPLEIRHRVSPATGGMRVRFVHFLLTDDCGLDLLRDRRFPLRIAPETAAELDRMLPEALFADAVRTPGELREAQLALFALVRRLLALSVPAPGVPTIPRWCREAARAIRDGGDGAIDLPGLIARSGVSRAKFYAGFKAAFQTTPAAFILQTRIRCAVRRKLARPELPVKELARLGGWPDPFHFSRMFKKVTRQSPRDYFADRLYGTARAEAGQSSAGPGKK